MKFLSHFAILLAVAGAAFAGKVSSDLNNAAPGTTVTAVIQFTAAPDSATLQAIGLKGGTLKKSFKKFQGGVFTVPASALAGIANMPQVKYMSSDRAIKAHLDLTTATVGADIARQYGWTGK